MTQPDRVAAPEGVVYSTSPVKALASDGARYVLKGPDLRVVFAECVAYALAERLSLSVPACALCNWPEETGLRFGSREKPVYSGIESFIRRGRIANPQLLGEMIAFDVWLANVDRNMGNLVGEWTRTDGTGDLTLFAIDFEKSMAVRSDDRFTVAGVAPRTLWPREDLGRLCRDAALPGSFCDRIAGLDADTIEATLDQAVLDLDMPTISWLATSVDVLQQRARDIHTLVQEVWANA